MKPLQVHLQTHKHDEMIDITRTLQEYLMKTGVKDGLMVVYCPHTTAGITINENADPDVKHDILMRLNEVYPWQHPQYKHGEGNTAAHLKSISVGASQSIIIEDSKLLLGRWQDVYFCEFDGPRPRTFIVKILPDA